MEMDDKMVKSFKELNAKGKERNGGITEGGKSSKSDFLRWERKFNVCMLTGMISRKRKVKDAERGECYSNDLEWARGDGL